MKAKFLLSLLAVFIIGCAGTFDLGLDRVSYRYGYGSQGGTGDHGQRVSDTGDYSQRVGGAGHSPVVFNCSSFPQGSEERAVCDEGLREREQQYLSNIYYHARDAGYGRGFNGLSDTRERYCLQHGDMNRKEACESGYAGGYDDGRAYYLERIRERARRGQF